MKEMLPAKATLVPKDAKRVFKGIIYDVYQWQQEMFDGSYKTFEMLKRPDTVHAIAIKDQKILALDEQQPGRPKFFKTPGGRVDEGESWLTAAKRELLEETGFTFNNWRLVFVSQPLVKIEWFVATYIATDFVSEQPRTQDEGEESVALWLSFDEFKDRLLKDGAPLIDYLRLAVEQSTQLDDLLHLPEFQGQEVDR